jgi:hypothetical protein
VVSALDDRDLLFQDFELVAAGAYGPSLDVFVNGALFSKTRAP